MTPLTELYATAPFGLDAGLMWIAGAFVYLIYTLPAAISIIWVMTRRENEPVAQVVLTPVAEKEKSSSRKAA